MTLDEILKGKGQGRGYDFQILHLDGSVEPDYDPAYFRLYKNPLNRHAYGLIKRDQVIGDVVPWTPEEMVQAGFTGVQIYRVPLNRGTQVTVVKVVVHKLGETIAGDGHSRRRPGGFAPGDCYYAQGTCAPLNQCCTEDDDSEYCICDDCCVSAEKKTKSK